MLILREAASDESYALPSERGSAAEQLPGGLHGGFCFLTSNAGKAQEDQKESCLVTSASRLFFHSWPPFFSFGNDPPENSYRDSAAKIVMIK